MIPKAFKVEILKITAQSVNKTQTCLPNSYKVWLSLNKIENMIHGNIFSIRENMISIDSS